VAPEILGFQTQMRCGPRFVNREQHATRNLLLNLRPRILVAPGVEVLGTAGNYRARSCEEATSNSLRRVGRRYGSLAKDV
jgi:hypothetical protein